MSEPTATTTDYDDLESPTPFEDDDVDEYLREFGPPPEGDTLTDAEEAAIDVAIRDIEVANQSRGPQDQIDPAEGN